MKKNKKAMSLIIVMWIVLITSLLALTLLEVIIPFSRSVVWMENSWRAYYLANSGLEEAMFRLKKDENIWNQENQTVWSFLPVNTNQILKYEMLTKASQEPIAWKWNSEFDLNKEWNRISVWEPIQMDISNLNIDELKIFFRTPSINWSNYELIDAGSTDKIFINWQLAWEDLFLNSSNRGYTFSWRGMSRPTTIFSKNGIDNSTTNWVSIWSMRWNTLEMTRYWREFYQDAWCSEWKKCSMKFSIVQDLKARDKITWREIILPYLEWKIVSWSWWASSQQFKKRNADISSEWVSSMYMKILNVKVPQSTVNEAFDFTVLQ